MNTHVTPSLQATLNTTTSTPPGIVTLTRAEKLRDQAAGLQSKIDEAFRHRPERIRYKSQLASKFRAQGHHLLRTQKALYALADLEEAGAVPPELQRISKAKVTALLRRDTPPVRPDAIGFKAGSETEEQARERQVTLALWDIIRRAGQHSATSAA